MLIPPEDTKHFLQVYQEAMKCAGVEDGKKERNLLTDRAALYQDKRLAHPPTGDKDLLAAFKTAVYGEFEEYSLSVRARRSW